jgi:UrcA family protein
MATPKTILPLSVASLLLAVAVPASAEMRTTEVRVSDLNLANPAGQQELESRIERAIKNVCRSNSSKSLSERQDVARCEASARTRAVAQAEARIAAYKAKNTRMASNAE